MSYSTDDDCYQEEFNRHGVSAQLKQLRPDGELHLNVEEADHPFCVSTGTRDLETARERADELCRMWPPGTSEADTTGDEGDDGLSGPPGLNARTYRALLQAARQLGPTPGTAARELLPMALQLVRHTGRRLEAARSLRWTDVCLGRAACVAALKNEGMALRWARDWPYGALHWRGEHNKRGRSSVMPVHERLHRALVRYRNQAWLGLVGPALGSALHGAYRMGEMPVLPSLEDPTEPVAADMLRSWLGRARRRVTKGSGPRDMPSRLGFHALRRLWFQERSHFSDAVLQAATSLAGDMQVPSSAKDARSQVSARHLYRVVTA